MIGRLPNPLQLQGHALGGMHHSRHPNKMWITIFKVIDLFDLFTQNNFLHV
jgi:hypothetical protein